MCKVTAAARVFRVRGSSFLEKTCLDSPKKRVAPKKKLLNAVIKKRRKRDLQLFEQALLIRRPLRWSESVSQLADILIQRAGCYTIVEIFSVVLQQVGTQLAPASDKAAFGRNFAHCIAHVGLYQADNFFEKRKPDVF